MSLNPLPALRKFIAKKRELRDFRDSSIKEVFTRIYLSNKWGGSESVSGKGSSLQRAAGLTLAVPDLFKRFGARSVLDIPCGDFHWMQKVDLKGIDYIGADMVTPLIEANNRKFRSAHHKFLQLDLTADDLPKVDVVFCSECLVHLSFENIFLALRNIRRSESTFLFATHFPALKRNQDIVTGKHRRLNFRLAPFHWPEPEYVYEEYDAGKGRGVKSIAVWKIASLPDPVNH